MEHQPLATIMIYGDMHLNSKNYGAHRNYPQESLDYFGLITEKMQEYKATHLIGLGDFSFNRFHSLEYRNIVELLLETQNEYTKGNRYELKGNHDSASYGMTEYEYYTERGLLKASVDFLDIGNLRLHMVDFKGWEGRELDIREGATNIALAHDFFKFENTRMRDYGKSIILDDLEGFHGLDYMICGHIHNFEAFSGSIRKGNQGHECIVTYLGCPCRPSYREGALDTEGYLALLTVYEGGTSFKIIPYDLLPLEESFNMQLKAEEMEEKEHKKQRVDISDIVAKLDQHERNIGDPEALIESLEGVDERYKKKAIELLRAAMA